MKKQNKPPGHQLSLERIIHMEQYQKPVMQIIELEEIDVLTKSDVCPICSSKTKYSEDLWVRHMNSTHSDYVALNPDYKDLFGNSSSGTGSNTESSS